MDKKYTISGYKTRHITPDDELTYSIKELREMGYPDPKRFIEVLGQQTLKVDELHKEITIVSKVKIVGDKWKNT